MPGSTFGVGGTFFMAGPAVGVAGISSARRDQIRIAVGAIALHRSGRIFRKPSLGNAFSAAGPAYRRHRQIRSWVRQFGTRRGRNRNTRSRLGRGQSTKNRCENNKHSDHDFEAPCLTYLKVDELPCIRSCTQCKGCSGGCSRAQQ